MSDFTWSAQSRLSFACFLIVFLSVNIHTFGSTDEAACPRNCTCIVNSQSNSLELSCPVRSERNKSTLLGEINQLLVTLKELVNLEIRNTFIESVPTEVCLLKQLRTLHLNSNEIKKLPDNCFTKLRDLEILTADNNNLNYLQDGLFDGLAHLQHISFNNNNISEIGLRLFSNSSDLRKLTSIGLPGNKLTSLEPWPFIRAKAAAENTLVIIDVSFNKIETFTNELDWNTTRCYASALSPGQSQRIHLNMAHNKVDHYYRLLEAIHFNSIIDYICWSKTVTIVLAKNPFFCDCLDYVIFAHASGAHYRAIIDGVICSNVDVLSVKALTVPLEKLVCDVTINCPCNCTCMKQPWNSTFHVICANVGLTGIPQQIPHLNFPQSFFSSRAKYRYKLDFSSNNISEIQQRYFFQDVIFFNASHSLLQNISENSWTELLQYAEFIYLNDNLLTTIPFVSNLSNFSFTKLSLYNNPFSCACNQLKIKLMLLTVYNRLQNPLAILCSSPKRLQNRPIFKVDDYSFCNESDDENYVNYNAVIIPLTVLCGLAILVFASFLISSKVRIKVFTTLGLHPFDLDECEGENVSYDVFLSYANEDSNLAQEIRSYLEQNSCKVCFHQRDFLAGPPIIDNILNAVCKSKRVLCIISHNFLASTWCMEEFHVALTHSVELKRQRLILIITSQFKFPEQWTARASDYEQNSEQSDSFSSSSSVQFDERFLSLKNFTERYTYLDLGSSSWKERLLYTMPIERLGCRLSEQPALLDDSLLNVSADYNQSMATLQRDDLNTSSFNSDAIGYEPVNEEDMPLLNN